MKLLNGQIEKSEINKEKVNRGKGNSERKPELKELSTYQQNLLPEGVASVEKLLNIYEVERDKKKFKVLKEFKRIHTGISLPKK